MFGDGNDGKHNGGGLVKISKVLVTQNNDFFEIPSFERFGYYDYPRQLVTASILRRQSSHSQLPVLAQDM